MTGVSWRPRGRSRERTRRLAAALAVVGAVVAGPAGTGPVVAAAMAQVVPIATFTMWSDPALTSLDGLGNWVAIGNEPAAGPGQLAPSWVYATTFGFLDGKARGAVALVLGPSGKSARFSLFEPDGTRHRAEVPFDWRAGRYYFLFVYRTAPGTYRSWVYDNSAGSWTYVGQLDLPDLGKIPFSAVTTALWTGPPDTRCSAFPRADVYEYRPFGFVGTTLLVADPPNNILGAGDCPVESTVVDTFWVHYRVGSDAAGP